jgi:D-arabinose 1-dehydrogenase-like Zn-dependent alcohol dehydrogenase
MRLAGEVALKPAVEPFALAEAPEALARLRDGRLHGAAVLIDPARP